MKLKQVLSAASAESLIQICESWGLPLPPAETISGRDGRKQLAEYLYPRLQANQYFRAAFDKLASEEKDVLHALTIHGGGLGQKELAERYFKGDLKACEQAIQGLRAKGFIFNYPDTDVGERLLGLPDSYLRFFDLPAHWKGFLGNILQGLPQQQFSELAGNVLGSTPRTTKRHVIIHRVRNKLLDPQALREYIGSLSELQQQMFATIIDKKGFCLYRDLLDPDSQKRFDHTKAEQLNALVATTGLVFAVAEGQNKYANLLMVPRDIYYIVSHGYAPDSRELHELDELSVASEDFLPTVILDNTETLLRDTVILASYIDSQNIKRLTSGGVSKNDLRKAVGLLSGNKTLRYATFLATFLIGKKLFIDVGGMWKSSENFVRWIQDSRQCYRELFAWWLYSSEWNEFTSEGSVFYAPQAVQNPSHAIEMRKLVLRGLSTIGEGKWIRFSAFAETILPQVETALPSRSSSRHASRPAALFVAIIERIIESLNWLGIVRVGLADLSHLEMIGSPAEAKQKMRPKRTRKQAEEESAEWDFSFQVVPFGQAVLNSSYLKPETVLSEEEVNSSFLRYDTDKFIVQPNLEIFAPPDLALSKLLYLTRFCEIRNTDVMTTFEMTRESLRKGMEQGLIGADILRFLVESSRMDLPETVKHLVQECAHRHGEALLCFAGGYITVEDSIVLEQIKSNPKLAPFVKDVIADKVIILAPNADLGKVAKEIRHLGLMPTIESETVHATSDERYHLTLTPQELCDLIAAMRLITFAEEELNADISAGKAASLVQKLRPETLSFYAYNKYTDSTAKTFTGKFQTALGKVLDDLSEKYKNQVSRLVTRSLSGRGPSKYHFRGPNPAVERADIVEMLSFAADYEFEIEILYLKQNDQEVRLMITPKSFVGDRLYAYCSQSDSDAMYLIERILRARLV